MDVKGLSESLKLLALKSGVAVDADFIGVAPLDIVASYCVALSGGRITEDKDILARVAGCGTVEHFLNSVSRPAVPVPTPEQIEAVQSGQLNKYVPPPKEPSKLEQAAKACLREYQRRAKLDAKSWGDEYTPIDMQKPWKGMHPQHPQHISNWGPMQIITWYVQDHGRPLYRHAGMQSMLPVIEKSTPEEFVAAVSEPYREVVL